MKIKVDGHAWNGFEIRFLKKFWMDGISKIGFLRLRMDEGKVSNGRKLETW